MGHFADFFHDNNIRLPTLYYHKLDLVATSIASSPDGYSLYISSSEIHHDGPLRLFKTKSVPHSPKCHTMYTYLNNAKKALKPLETGIPNWEYVGSQYKIEIYIESATKNTHLRTPPMPPTCPSIKTGTAWALNGCKNQPFSLCQGSMVMRPDGSINLCKTVGTSCEIGPICKSSETDKTLSQKCIFPVDPSHVPCMTFQGQPWQFSSDQKSALNDGTYAIEPNWINMSYPDYNNSTDQAEMKSPYIIPKQIPISPWKSKPNSQNKRWEGNGMGGMQSNWIGPFNHAGANTGGTDRDVITPGFHYRADSMTFQPRKAPPQQQGPDGCNWGGGSQWWKNLTGGHSPNQQVYPFPLYYYIRYVGDAVVGVSYNTPWGVEWNNPDKHIDGTGPEAGIQTGLTPWDLSSLWNITGADDILDISSSIILLNYWIEQAIKHATNQCNLAKNDLLKTYYNGHVDNVPKYTITDIPDLSSSLVMKKGKVIMEDGTVNTDASFADIISGIPPSGAASVPLYKYFTQFTSTDGSDVGYYDLKNNDYQINFKQSLQRIISSDQSFITPDFNKAVGPNYKISAAEWWINIQEPLKAWIATIGSGYDLGSEKYITEMKEHINTKLVDCPAYTILAAGESTYKNYDTSSNICHNTKFCKLTKDAEGNPKAGLYIENVYNGITQITSPDSDSAGCKMRNDLTVHNISNAYDCNSSIPEKMQQNLSCQADQATTHLYSDKSYQITSLGMFNTGKGGCDPGNNVCEKNKNEKCKIPPTPPTPAPVYGKCGTAMFPGGKLQTTLVIDCLDGKAKEQCANTKNAPPVWTNYPNVCQTYTLSSDIPSWNHTTQNHLYNNQDLNLVCPSGQSQIIDPVTNYKTSQIQMVCQVVNPARPDPTPVPKFPKCIIDTVPRDTVPCKGGGCQGTSRANGGHCEVNGVSAESTDYRVCISPGFGQCETSDPPIECDCKLNRNFYGDGYDNFCGGKKYCCCPSGAFGSNSGGGGGGGKCLCILNPPVCNPACNTFTSEKACDGVNTGCAWSVPSPPPGPTCATKPKCIDATSGSCDTTGASPKDIKCQKALMAGSALPMCSAKNPCYDLTEVKSMTACCPNPKK